MRKMIRLILTILGSAFLGIILHELYHYLTLKDVEQVCLVFGDSTAAYIRGSGGSSEVIAYIIYTITVLVGVGFVAYDLFKE